MKSFKQYLIENKESINFEPSEFLTNDQLEHFTAALDYPMSELELEPIQRSLEYHRQRELKPDDYHKAQYFKSAAERTVDRLKKDPKFKSHLDKKREEWEDMHQSNMQAYHDQASESNARGRWAD